MAFVNPAAVVTVGAVDSHHLLGLYHTKFAARAFGIDPDRKIDAGKLPDREVEFDTDAAKEDLSGDGTAKKGQRARAKSGK